MLVFGRRTTHNNPQDAYQAIVTAVQNKDVKKFAMYSTKTHLTYVDDEALDTFLNDSAKMKRAHAMILFEKIPHEQMRRSRKKKAFRLPSTVVSWGKFTNGQLETTGGFKAQANFTKGSKAFQAAWQETIAQFQQQMNRTTGQLSHFLSQILPFANHYNG